MAKEGRKSVAQKSQSTPSVSQSIDPHGLKYKADAICSLIAAAEVDEKLKVQGLAQIHLIGIPNAADLESRICGQLVAVLSRIQCIAIEVVNGVALCLGHEAYGETQENGQTKGFYPQHGPKLGPAPIRMGESGEQRSPEQVNNSCGFDPSPWVGKKPI